LKAIVLKFSGPEVLHLRIGTPPAANEILLKITGRNASAAATGKIRAIIDRTCR
jgi:hypothetical protein